MERDYVKFKVKKLLEDVLDSDEFVDFKREIEYRQRQNLKPQKSSRFILSIAGKLVEEAEEFSNLVGFDWASDLTELIDELQVACLADIYGAETLKDIYERYSIVDFIDVDTIYDSLSDKASIEIKVKANPLESPSTSNPKDVVTMVYNFGSAEEYAVYLALESLDMFRIDIEEGWVDPEEEGIEDYEDYEDDEDFAEESVDGEDLEEFDESTEWQSD